MQHNLDAAIEFLEAFRQGGPCNLTAIVPDGPVHSATFTNPDKARAWLARHVEHANIYFVVNPAPQPTGSGGRVNKPDISVIANSHVDIDVDKQDNDLSLEERKAEALRRLEAADNPPTFVTDSGGGLQGIWRLAEPVPATPDNIEWAERANRWLVEEFGGDRLTTDISRLLRLPGTINFPDKRKRARGRVIAPTRLVRSTGELHGREAFGQVQRATREALSDKDIDVGLIEHVDDIDALVEQYGLDDRTRAIIIHGRVPGQRKPGDDSRDKWMIDACCQMVRADVPVGVIAGVLLNAEWGISGHVLDHTGRPTEVYAMRQAMRAEGMVRAGQREDFADAPVDPKLVAEAAGEQRARATRFKRWSLTELMDLPPPEWLVDGMVPEGGLVQIYGARKTTKTFLCIDLALCIATGRPYHGVEVKQGRVTYVIGEGGAARFGDRVLAWCRHNGVEPESLDRRFSVVPVRVGVDGDDLKEFLAADREPCALTVFDTLARCMDGDENSTADMNKAVKGLDAVREHYKGAVIVVHHSGKDLGRQGRGSTALPGAVDATLKVTREGDRTVLQVEENRHGEQGLALSFEPVPIVVSNDLMRSSLAMRFVERLNDKTPVSGEDHVLVRIAERGEVAARSDLVDPFTKGMSRANVHKAIASLRERGLVTESEVEGIRATPAGIQQAKRLGAVVPDEEDW